MRVSLLAVTIALLGACSAAPGPSQSIGPSPSPSPTEPPTARILGPFTGFFDNEPFKVAAAMQPADWAELWASLGKQGSVPDVDFSREVVFFLGMAGSSSCPEQFERLVVDEPTGHVYAEWAAHPPNQPCTDDLQAQGVLLAVARSVLPAQQFRLTLREDLVCVDCPTHPDQVVVNPDQPL